MCSFLYTASLYQALFCGALGLQEHPSSHGEAAGLGADGANAGWSGLQRAAQSRGAHTPHAPRYYLASQTVLVPQRSPHQPGQQPNPLQVGRHLLSPSWHLHIYISHHKQMRACGLGMPGIGHHRSRAPACPWGCLLLYLFSSLCPGLPVPPPVCPLGRPVTLSVCPGLLVFSPLQLPTWGSPWAPGLREPGPD